MQQRAHIEAYNQQKQLEEQIAKKWGYHFISYQPTFTLASKMAKVEGNQTLLNQNMNPLKQQKVKIAHSTNFSNLISELERQQYRKILQEAKRKNNGEDIDINRLVRDKVMAYNFVLDHKHLQETPKQKQVDEQKIKNSTELLVDEIQRKNQNLNKVQNLSEEFKRNKKINNLYKSFATHMFDHPKNQPHSLHKTTYSYHNPMSRSIDHYNRYPTTISKFKFKRDHYNDSLTSKPKVDLKDPMKIKGELKKQAKLSLQQKSNNHKLLVYRTKISEKMNTYRQLQQKRKKLKEQKSVRKSKHKLQKQRRKNSFLFEDEQDDTIIQQRPQQNHNSYFNDNKNEQLAVITPVYFTDLKEQKTKQVQNIADYLIKRNTKFKKPWGNRILIKYDHQEEAKKLFDAQYARPQSKSESKIHQEFFSTSYKTSRNSRYGNKNHVESKLSELNQSMTENKRQIEDNEMYLNIIEADEEQEDINRKYKNEKRNLFLRMKKQ